MEMKEPKRINTLGDLWSFIFSCCVFRSNPYECVCVHLIKKRIIFLFYCCRARACLHFQIRIHHHPILLIQVKRIHRCHNRHSHPLIQGNKWPNIQLLRMVLPKPKPLHTDRLHLVLALAFPCHHKLHHQIQLAIRQCRALQQHPIHRHNQMPHTPINIQRIHTIFPHNPHKVTRATDSNRLARPPAHHIPLSIIWHRAFHNCKVTSKMFDGQRFVCTFNFLVFQQQVCVCVISRAISKDSFNILSSVCIKPVTVAVAVAVASTVAAHRT